MSTRHINKLRSQAQYKIILKYRERLPSMAQMARDSGVTLSTINNVVLGLSKNSEGIDIVTDYLRNDPKGLPSEWNEFLLEYFPNKFQKAK